VEKIASRCLTGIQSKEGWEQERLKLRAQLFEMLSLEPRPSRGDLKPVVTGKVERDDFLVEKLHFQSLPGLYVTANLYLPKKIVKPLPAILYVCGHGQVKTNGVSYGNKVAYQHHGAWFARNGYACLIIDTIQLGEIEGLHHGTHREGMWWWNSRGYTPAGVEAWNCMRALDYLETRPEVDKTRFGVTGRSGGGAYSWWIAALDDRIKVAAPVAGITDLENHVVDGVVEGHCDCMFFVNTYRWDYPTLAALVAPRPLLLANSDKDGIFPLVGVVRTHAKVAPIYNFYGAETNLGLLITEGPHKDTQDLQLPVFRWFNRHLKGEDPIIEMAATKFFTGQELKVFSKIPPDEITSRTHESFVPAEEPTGEMLDEARVAKARSILKEKSFRGWPESEVPPQIERKTSADGVQEIAFNSQQHIRLKLYLKLPPGSRSLALRVLAAGAPQEEIDRHLKAGDGARAVLLVRNVGADTAETDRKGVQVKRRYMLVGQTLDGMRVWDIVRGMQVLAKEAQGATVVASADGKQEMNLLVASLFSPPFKIEQAGPNVASPTTPDYLNVLRLISWADLEEVALHNLNRASN
jgi:dienelactone hydrolase